MKGTIIIWKDPRKPALFVGQLEVIIILFLFDHAEWFSLIHLVKALFTTSSVPSAGLGIEDKFGEMIEFGEFGQ